MVTYCEWDKDVGMSVQCRQIQKEVGEMEESFIFVTLICKWHLNALANYAIQPNTFPTVDKADDVLCCSFGGFVLVSEVARQYLCLLPTNHFLYIISHRQHSLTGSMGDRGYRKSTCCCDNVKYCQYAFNGSPNHMLQLKLNFSDRINLVLFFIFDLFIYFFLKLLLAQI